MPKKTVLLVDDDELLNDMLADFLGEHVDVLRASNGLEAIEIYKERQGEIRLVLTDWKMPKLDGIKLAKWLLDASLTLPLFLMTGYPDAPEVNVFQNIDRVRIIAKPFDFDEMTKLVVNCVGA